MDAGKKEFPLARNQSATFGPANAVGYPGRTLIELFDVDGNPLGSKSIAGGETKYIPIGPADRTVRLSGHYYNWDSKREEPYKENGVRLSQKADGTGYDWACDDGYFGVDFKNFTMSILIETAPWPTAFRSQSDAELSRASLHEIMPIHFAAILALRLSNSVQVEVRADHTWSCPGDPHGVLPERAGEWAYSASSGTNLLAGSRIVAQLVAWSLGSAHQSETGGVHLYAGGQDSFGEFEVVKLVDSFY